MVTSKVRFLLLGLAILFVVPLQAQQSIFSTQTPQVQVDTDNAAGEYGVIFTSSAAGQITALRFWKSSSDTGAHTGRLWRVSDRVLLATVTFSNANTATGWQTQNLSSPVAIVAGTQYLVTVSTPRYYGYTNRGLANVIANGALSTVVGSNGVYGMTLGAYPTLAYQNSNYFRDVVFVPSGGTTPTIDVTPNAVTLNFNQQQQFSAALGGGATGPVTWSATCGAVNGSGLYTAPASGTSCTVTGQVTGASDASTVTLTSAPAPTIDVTPNALTLSFNQQQQFLAALGGGATGPVAWSTTCGSINSSGLFTAPSAGSSCTVTGAVTGASDQSTITLNQPSPSTSTFYFKDFREPDWYVMNRTSDTTNNETACYRPEQVSMANGLTITAINQANTCSSGISSSQQWPYTSGMIQWNSRAWRYGTLEFRAKFPRDGGVWPSLWMLGDACQTWYKTLIPPDCPGAGEIDVLEIFSGSSGVNQQIHVDTHHDQCSPTLDVTQYHVYQLIWQPGSLVWKIDGNTTCTVTASYVPSNPMFLIINLALGGIGGGTVDANKLPQSLTMDYVKITQ